MSRKLFKFVSKDVVRSVMATRQARLHTIVSYHPQGPKGDMLKSQSSLPRLPVPPLQQSLQKYLRAIKPIINEIEYQKTLKVVEKFGRKNGEGERLQKALEERAKTHDSWLKEWWDREAYLGFRESVVITSNPSITHPKYHAIDRDSFFRHATKMIVVVAKYLLLIRSAMLPPEMTKDGPVCMSQHRRSPIDQSCHIIVAHNGHLFSLDILCQLSDGSYGLVPAQHIEEQLHSIVNSTPVRAQYPLGVLTSEHRDTWYQARERLLTDPVNSNSLDVIERAQFIISLDSAHPGIDPHSPTTVDEMSIMSGRCLHGNGSAHDSCNRWFDHALQLFVAPDGGNGSNIEHSAADGVASAQVNAFALDNMNSDDLLTYTSPVSNEQLTQARQLDWKISSESANDIETAKVNIDSAVSDCDHQNFVFEDFGKDYVKSQKLSPDCFMQVALQLTYYKMYGHFTATYESASTRKFLFGRTDTIRGTTAEALEFCKAMSNPTATDTERASKLVGSVQAHRKSTVEAMSGEAFDRHLLGLKLLVKEELPSLYTDPVYSKAFHFCLSTSQIPSEHGIISGFGAVVPDGYGVCYNPMKSKYLISISSFWQCPQTNSAKFGTALKESLKEMRNVLNSNVLKAKL
ncbi:carnitine O-acetyltransferase-like isoform X2 [Dysidea avara]|uniref:carnitine O-acetyltransferase-like isoform X2 n=1 Tax=Dysidea avara TaxID=196820 RepID=UPI00331CC55F